MTIATLLEETLSLVMHSWMLQGLAYGAAILIASTIIIAALLAATIVLHSFFKRHPVIKRARKVLVYLLTICGVLALVLAGILGLVLPVIPGVVLILAGLLLLRKYHKFSWLEKKIRSLRERVRRERRRREKTKRDSLKSGKA